METGSGALSADPPLPGRTGPVWPARRRVEGVWDGFWFLLMGGIRVSLPFLSVRRRWWGPARWSTPPLGGVVVGVIAGIGVFGVGVIVGITGALAPRSGLAGELIGIRELDILHGLTGLADRDRHTDLVDRVGLPLAVDPGQIDPHRLTAGDVLLPLPLGVSGEDQDDGRVARIEIHLLDRGVGDVGRGDGLLLRHAGPHVLGPLLLLREERARGRIRQLLQRLVDVAVVEAERVLHDLRGHLHDLVTLVGGVLVLSRLPVLQPEHDESDQTRNQHDGGEHHQQGVLTVLATAYAGVSVIGACFSAFLPELMAATVPDARRAGSSAGRRVTGESIPAVPRAARQPPTD
ncbi:hypothetical protein ACFSSF_03170 [Dietzia aerolata]|uniref:hypothetical protein n=1 Tax=Dietzia aerolata TaxID=595984 RepID=UPI00362C8463